MNNTVADPESARLAFHFGCQRSTIPRPSKVIFTHKKEKSRKAASAILLNKIILDRMQLKKQQAQEFE